MKRIVLGILAIAASLLLYAVAWMALWQNTSEAEVPEQQEAIADIAVANDPVIREHLAVDNQPATLAPTESAFDPPRYEDAPTSATAEAPTEWTTKAAAPTATLVDNCYVPPPPSSPPCDAGFSPPGVPNQALVPGLLIPGKDVAEVDLMAGKKFVIGISRGAAPHAQSTVPNFRDTADRRFLVREMDSSTFANGRCDLIIYCQTIEVHAGEGDSQTPLAFSCQGDVDIASASTLIRARNATYENQVLTCEDAEIMTPDTILNAEKCSLPFALHGFHITLIPTGTPPECTIEAVPDSVVVPFQGPAFQPVPADAPSS